MADVDEPLTSSSEMVTRRGVSRRRLLGGSAAVGALAAVNAPLAFGATAVAAGRSGDDGRRGGAGSSTLGFGAVSPSVDDAVMVPDWLRRPGPHPMGRPDPA